MSRASHDVPPEDLVAYLDGELSRERRAAVEAHLATCPDCRRRLDALAAIGDILRQTPVDDAPGRARTLGRIEDEARAPRRPVASLPSVSALAGAALSAVLFLFLAVTNGTAPTDAATGLTRFIREWSERPQAASRDVALDEPMVAVEATAVPSEFSPVEPATLPFGLRLTERAVDPQGSVQLTYRNDRHLAIRLVQASARQARAAVLADETEVVTVGGIDVLWGRGHDVDDVSWLLWERGSVTFQVLVVEASTMRLTVDDIGPLVETIVAAQDRIS